MRFKTLALLLTITLFGSVPAWGQTGIVTIDDVTSGLYNTDTLKIDDSIAFLFRMENNTGQLITGFSNGFRIYSPQGATWTTSGGTHTGAIPFTMMENFFVNPFSITGADADTIGFGGF